MTEVITEYRNENTKDIDLLSTIDMVRKMNEEDLIVAKVVGDEAANIAAAIDIIAKACTNGNIIKHTKTQCCGFAGNKGFICPELNESALRELSEFYVQKKQVDKHLRRGFASSSTCEIGLNDKTNIIWQNLLYLVDEVSESL